MPKFVWVIIAAPFVFIGCFLLILWVQVAVYQGMHGLGFLMGLLVILVIFAVAYSMVRVAFPRKTDKQD